jgi:enoyl-CoA hydratase
MDYETILYQVDDRVAVLTLNRPERMNSFNLRLREEVVAALKSAGADSEVRVVVIKGAGGKAFSAGYDIQETAASAKKRTLEDWHMILGEEYEFCMSPWRCPKPVIAQIEGHCLAGGLEFAQLCDVRYAAEGSRFGVVETRFSNGILNLVMPWILGARCRELIFTGDTFDTAEALRLGLINRVFPKPDLDREVMKIAKRMSRVAMACLTWNKRAINHTFETMGFNAAMQYGFEACTIMDATETPEYKAFNALRAGQGLGAALKHLKDTFAPYE